MSEGDYCRTSRSRIFCKVSSTCVRWYVCRTANESGSSKAVPICFGSCKNKKKRSRSLVTPCSPCRISTESGSSNGVGPYCFCRRQSYQLAYSYFIGVGGKTCLSLLPCAEVAWKVLPVRRRRSENHRLPIRAAVAGGDTVDSTNRRGCC